MYTKVIEKNNWGSASHHIDDYEFRGGEKVRVSWPDSFVSVHSVFIKKEQGTVDDMGHAYHYTGTPAYIQIDHHGVKIDLRLTGLMLEKMI